MIFFVIAVLSLPACPFPNTEGYSIVKYFKPDCPHCLKVTPALNEIEDRIKGKKSDVPFLSVDCSTCDCSQKNIAAVPSLLIYKGEDEVARFRGVSIARYDDIADFISGHAKIPEDVFVREKIISENVLTLYEKDFFSGFSGPWLILFYSKKDDKEREMMKEIATVYKGKLNVGEISSENAQNLIHQYNILSFPAILGIFDGLTAGYLRKHEVHELSKFVDEFIEPSFKEIDLSEFEEMASKNIDGQPIFVVFYTDLKLANEYFKEAAQSYKMKAKIYKSDDTKLFHRANIYPAKNDEEGEKVILSVYKGNSFHRCKAQLDDTEEVADWLFHAHFPHVTHVTVENFYNIFHGYKPIVLLLTGSEFLVNELNIAAKKLSMGRPFTEELFVALDALEFPLFIPSLLPKMAIPSIAIFNPQTQTFYHRDVELKPETFQDELLKHLNDFKKGKLEAYPPRVRYEKLIFVGALLALAIGVAKIFVTKKQVKKE